MAASLPRMIQFHRCGKLELLNTALNQRDQTREGLRVQYGSALYFNDP